MAATSALAPPALEWYYADPSRQTTGPVTRLQLATLVKTGVLPRQTTLVWKQGMAEWLTIPQIQELATSIPEPHPDAIHLSQPPQAATTSTEVLPSNPEGWYYLDRYRSKHGPVTRTALVELYRSFKVSDVTMVAHSPGEPRQAQHTPVPWQRLSDIPELQSDLSSVHQQLQEQNAAGSTRAPNNGGEEGEQSNKVGSKRKAPGSGSGGGGGKGGKKKWKGAQALSHVYITGLPTDITAEELHLYMKKCGIVKQDPLTGEHRVRIYKDPTDPGKGKGDATVVYLREESVPLAISILHETEIRPGYPISVSKAEYTIKGGFDPKKAAVGKQQRQQEQLTEHEKVVRKKMYDQEQLLGWEEEGTELEDIHAGLRIVILKHMFTLDEVAAAATHSYSAEAVEAGKQHRGESTGVEVDAVKLPSSLITDEGISNFYAELEREVGSELESTCGPVLKIIIFESSPIGAVSVKFKYPSAARKCIEAFHGRFFAGRRIECDYWDGATDYKVRESEEDEKSRIEGFGKWLEAQGNNNAK